MTDEWKLAVERRIQAIISSFAGWLDNTAALDDFPYIQSGETSVTQSTSAWTSISFTNAFSNTPRVVTGGLYAGSGPAVVSSISTTGFSARYHTGTAGSSNLDWLAIGRKVL